MAVKVHGLREVTQRLKNLPKELSGKNGGPVRSALFQAAKIIKEDAIARAPVGQDTPNPGRLKRNIIVLRDRNPKSTEGAPTELYHVGVRGGGKYGARVRKRERRRVRGEGGTIAQAQQAAIRAEKDAYYWRFIEFGTSKMPARPFLRPAFESQKAAAVKKFADVLQKVVARLEKKVR